MITTDLITEWAIRYAENGLTPIPITVSTREPKVKYGHYKDTAQEISEVQSWLDKGMFNDDELNGLALMTGKCTRGKFRNTYIQCVDIDGKEIFDKLLEIYSLEQLSKNDIFVEQHFDNKFKVHLWVWSERPFPSAKLEGIEVKSNGMLCNIFPGHHKTGNRYMPIGDSLKIFQDGTDALLNDNFINVIDKITDGKYFNQANYNPVLRNKTKIPKGSRHNELIRYANSIIAKLHKTTNRDTILKYLETYKQQECQEPETFSEAELTQIFNDAWKNIEKSNPAIQSEEAEQVPEIQQNFEQELTNKYQFKSMKDTGEIWYYDGKIYQKNAEWLIQQECIRYDPESKTTDVNDILNRIKWSNYIDRDAFDQDIKWIACDNVMVNLLTGETAKHDPKFMVTVQIPHKYIDLHKTPYIPAPPKILQFFNEVIVNPDKIETMFDFMAYCLWRAFPFHRWLLLNGSGRNGKGVTTDLVTKFLGENNVSSEELQRILKNNFASARLYGKMANIDADLSSEELKQTGRLKKLTGNDRIPAENKFKAAFDFRNYAKMIFSANQMPLTPDESDAFFIRILIINFPNQFLGNNVNPDKLAEITTPEEMSMLLSFLVRRLPHVLKNGISYKDDIEENRVKWIQSADPIRIFIELAIRSEAGCWATKDGVYDEYENFCLDKNLPKESQETFSRRLKVEGYKDKRKSVDGQKIYVWTDVKLEDYRQIERRQSTLDFEDENE